MVEDVKVVVRIVAMPKAHDIQTGKDICIKFAIFVEDRKRRHEALLHCISFEIQSVVISQCDQEVVQHAG